MLNNVTQNTDIIETLRKQRENGRDKDGEARVHRRVGRCALNPPINWYDRPNYSVNSRYRTSTNGGCRRIVWPMDQGTIMSIVNVGLSLLCLEWQ